MALKLDPVNIEAAIAGGRAAKKLNKFEDAYNFYKIGLSVDPNHAEIVSDLRSLQEVRRPRRFPHATPKPTSACRDSYSDTIYIF